MSELVLTTEGETHVVVKQRASYARLERISGRKAAS